MRGPFRIQSKSTLRWLKISYLLHALLYKTFRFEKIESIVKKNMTSNNSGKVLKLFFPFQTYVFLMVSTGFWLMKALAVIYQVFQFWDIKLFYNQVKFIKQFNYHFVSNNLYSTWSVHQCWILPVGNIVLTESGVSFSSWIPFFQALHISDDDLASLTWYDVQKRLVEAQVCKTSKSC